MDLKTTGLFPAGVSPVQDSVSTMLSGACFKHGITDKHQIAYVYATAYHEARLKPIEEIGKGALRPYGKMLKQQKDAKGNHIPYSAPDQIYYGRGLCQITWYENYKMFSDLLHINLIDKPEYALVPANAAEIIVIGMKGGLFTGVGLSHYFTPTSQDPINARKIINGLDCADLIKGYYEKFLVCC